MKFKRQSSPPSPDEEELPPWFERPQSRSQIQKTLFPENLHRVLARLKVSANELSRWYKVGWVSFGAASIKMLEPEQIAEIIFVRDVLRAGLPDAYVEMLLKQLPKPLGVDPDKVSYSFRHGWVITDPPVVPDPPDPFEQIDEYLDQWLEGLVEQGETERLLELRDKINDSLNKLSKVE